MARTRTRCVVLKLGGELLEQPEDVARVAKAIAALSPGPHAGKGRAEPGPQMVSGKGRRSGPGLQVVVVHGGGKEIDAALAVAGIPKQQVDGLRVTDAATLDVVVSVLAGAINTRLVAAVRKAGAKPVGLTGADATVVTVKRAAPITTTAGTIVDLGLVGAPVANGKPELLADLMSRGYVPIVACVGSTRDGRLMNVNADTLASHLASALGARRLVIAGGTSGVLDEQGKTIARMTGRDAARLIKAGTANKGMVAKLQACRAALAGGVRDVVIANGRASRLEAVAIETQLPDGCTQVVR
ncbi:MAG TPA: acetylglutamate kinase [Vicinamibacterales bacterium]|nr:acetylglutamate kinase [Vicinamibacterales bacterium]